MIDFYENEALDMIIAAGIEQFMSRQSIDVVIAEWHKHPSVVAHANKIIIEILNHSDFQNALEVVPDQRTFPIPGSLSSLLFKFGKDGIVESMTFYRIKEAWLGNTISLLGATLAIMAIDPSGGLLAAAGLSVETWKNLLVLKRPADDCEIDCYSGLLSAMAKRLDGQLGVTVPEIMSAMEYLYSNKDTAKGLNSLRRLGLVEICKPTSSEITNPNNTEDVWRPRW